MKVIVPRNVFLTISVVVKTFFNTEVQQFILFNIGLLFYLNMMEIQKREKVQQFTFQQLQTPFQ